MQKFTLLYMSAKQANNRLPPASNVATGENKASGALRTGHHRYQIRKNFQSFPLQNLYVISVKPSPEARL